MSVQDSGRLFSVHQARKTRGHFQTAVGGKDEQSWPLLLVPPEPQLLGAVVLVPGLGAGVTPHS